MDRDVCMSFCLFVMAIHSERAGEEGVDCGASLALQVCAHSVSEVAGGSVVVKMALRSEVVISCGLGWIGNPGTNGRNGVLSR